MQAVESYLRLVAAYLIEYIETLANEYAYIRPEKLRPVWDETLTQGAN